MKYFSGFFLVVALAALWPSPGWARTVVPFSGTVDLRSQEASLFFGWKDKQQLSLTITRPSPQSYHLSLDISHLKTALGDIAAVVDGDLDLTGDSPEKRELSGRFRSRYTLLNYTPIRDLSFKFSLRERKFYIYDLSLGAFSGRGDIALDLERRINITVDLRPLDLEEAGRFLGIESKGRPIPLTGVATGMVNLNGALARPDIKGRVAFYNGRLKAFDFDSIILDFEGTWPLVRLKDSLITQAEGFSFKFNGVLDLSDLASLGTQVRMFQKVPIVSVDKAKREWVFKRQRDGRDLKTEMKYFLMKDDRGDTGAVLGVQKSLEF
jgi:hypothetical protein